MVLGPLAYWDCRFEFCRGRGYPSVVSIVCCQVEICATGRWLVLRSLPSVLCLGVVEESPRGGQIGLSIHDNRKWYKAVVFKFSGFRKQISFVLKLVNAILTFSSWIFYYSSSSWYKISAGFVYKFPIIFFSRIYINIYIFWRSCVLASYNCNWWPTRCNSFVYLFIPNQLYMFRTMFSPIIRSTWLYLQLLI